MTDQSLVCCRQKENLLRAVRSLQVASQTTLQRAVPLLSSQDGLGLLGPSQIHHLSEKSSQFCRDLEDVGNLLLFRQDEITQKILIPSCGGSSSVHWCSDSSFYVCGANGPYIHLIASNGKPAQVLHCFDEGIFLPDCITMTRPGSVATIDLAEGLVRIYNPNSQPSWVKVGGKFMSPRGISLDSTGRILVAEYGSGTVQGFHVDRAFRVQGVRQVSGLRGPVCVCSTPDGGFAVSEECGDVKIFNSNFKLTGSLSKTYQHTFGNPAGICCDPEGNILVADEQKKNVTLFPPNGSPICVVSKGLEKPAGVACSHFGFLYVADSGDNCVKIYRYRVRPYYNPTSPRGTGEVTGKAMS
ncbi:NHL-repeat-containing protein 4 [Pelobates fuscus]|uniref:NHL-repeat-containing protein 4 n=1 Tax=Pelobates fuscus TaxID=191477 RepID=UPI002FE4B3BB